jgi:hypothetical protein
MKYDQTGAGPAGQPLRPFTVGMLASRRYPSGTVVTVNTNGD